MVYFAQEVRRSAAVRREGGGYAPWLFRVLCVRDKKKAVYFYCPLVGSEGSSERLVDTVQTNAGFLTTFEPSLIFVRHNGRTPWWKSQN